MGQNWKIDPVKRDYVLENGSMVPTDRVEEKAYLILAYPRQQCMYSTPGQGSEMYLFANTKRTNAVEALFAARATQAIKKQLIASGQAQAVTVANLEASRTGSSNQVSITPNDPNLSVPLKFNPL